jgi:deazaflavin-dependent oxidoreductase (nitroreductase family)
MNAQPWARPYAPRTAARRYSLFHLLIQRLASSKLGSSLLSRTLHPLDRIAFKLTRGRTTLATILAGIPVLVLTTLGAKSGMAHTLPVLGLPIDYAPESFAIVASNWGQTHHPAWYYNLLAHPRATCTVEGHTGEYVAHRATGEEYERLWRCALETYVGFSIYQKRAGDRRIPIMVMTPIREK